MLNVLYLGFGASFENGYFEVSFKVKRGKNKGCFKCVFGRWEKGFAGCKVEG